LNGTEKVRDSFSSDNLITIFIPSVHGGGAERAMLVFAAELIELGFKVDLVLVRLEGQNVNRIPAGTRVVNLDCRRMLTAIPKLIRYLKNHKPRAVYSTITHANIALSFAARVTRVSYPVIVRQSNAPISETKDSIGRKIARRIIPSAYRSVSGIIAVSDGVREELVNLSQDLESLISVIPTPVISEQLLSDGAPPPSHPWFEQPQDERDVPVIVSAGRLEPHKGMLDLIRAFRSVRDKVEARLIILGDGSQRRELLKAADALGLRDDVDLVGFKTNPYGYMNHANVFALASWYEGLPNVLIQALAFGTPVVATDCPSGPREILEDGRLGRLVRVGDVIGLSDALTDSLSLSKSPEARQSMLKRFGAREATLRYLGVGGAAIV
jgi:glycosyltransferase involved in cell wall biosynthesis